MPENRKLGLVTVTYNSAKVLPEFIESLRAQTYSNWQLFIIDNGSTDTTLELLSQYPDPRLKIIANKKNVGVAAGNNQGIREALQEDCELIGLINNDIEFGSDMFEILLNHLNQLKCDMVVPKMYYYEHKNLIWFAGGGFRKFRYWLNEHYGMDSIDTGEYNQVKSILYAPTCCVVMKRDVFDRVGFMDEKYFVYFDDSDFFIRANRLGIRTYYIPQAFLFHKVSSLTGRELSEFRAFIENRNLIFFVRKHFSFTTFVLALFLQQLVFITKLLSKHDSYKVFRAKQKGFWTGFRGEDKLLNN
jgi:GT2 family glycosyltransferase